jgi:hypothetical protein
MTLSASNLDKYGNLFYISGKQYYTKGLSPEFFGHHLSEATRRRPSHDVG